MGCISQSKRPSNTHPTKPNTPPIRPANKPNTPAISPITKPKAPATKPIIPPAMPIQSGKVSINRMKTIAVLLEERAIVNILTTSLKNKAISNNVAAYPKMALLVNRFPDYVHS